MSFESIKRKIYMDNYYDDLKNRAERYRLQFMNSPRKAALRMIWWNFKSLFKHHVQPYFGSDAYKNGDKDPYTEYLRFLEKHRVNYADTFVELSKDSYERRRQDTKIIAWYFPQYYHTSVNSRFHRRGFTKRIHTTRTIPFPPGRNQPHIPYDAGCYGLTNVEIMKHQVELAKKYGIYGFCFQWYRFFGERAIEGPVETYLQHPELDLPFFLNWANEGRTAPWAGKNQNPTFDQHFIDSLIPYFKDCRYIKINGRPILSIYYCAAFDQQCFASFLDHCREAARKEGFPDLYVILAAGIDLNIDPREWGADAIAEYPALTVDTGDRKKISGQVDTNFKGDIFDYPSLAERGQVLRKTRSEECFRSAMAGFDDSVRKVNRPNCFILENADPEFYKAWMKRIIEESKLVHSGDDNIVFALAWNGWAEAAYLGPDIKFGYGYLQAAREALEETRTLDEDIILDKISQKQAQGITAIHFYINCVESLGDIIACEPIARFLKKTVPDCKVTWLVRDCYQDIVKYNANIDEITLVDCLGSAIMLCKRYQTQPDSIVVDCHFDGQWCAKMRLNNHNPNNPMINANTYFWYGGLLSNFCLSAGLPALKTAPVFHEAADMCPPRELPERFVVIHCISAMDCRNWDRDKWNELVTILIRRGYSVVEIGRKPVIQNAMPEYFDCTDIHNFQDIAQIVKRADCFIGIDSAFAHLANCYKIPGILIYGRYGNFDRYNPYTGAYGNGESATLIFADNGDIACAVRVEQVMEAFDARMGLKGRNMQQLL